MLYFLQLWPGCHTPVWVVPAEEAGGGHLPWPEPTEPHSPVQAARHHCHIPSAKAAGWPQARRSLCSCGRRAGREEDATLAAPEVSLTTACPRRQPPFALPGPWFCILALNLSSSHHSVLLCVCFSSFSTLSAEEDNLETCFSVSFQSHSLSPCLMLLIFVLEEVNNHPLQCSHSSRCSPRPSPAPPDTRQHSMPLPTLVIPLDHTIALATRDWRCSLCPRDRRSMDPHSSISTFCP